MLGIRVVDGDENTRSFHFVSREVRVGFRPGTDISLQPFSAEGAEIRIWHDVDTKTYMVEPVAIAGAFSLGQAQILSAVRVIAGDVLSIKGYQLQLKEVDGQAGDAENLNGEPVRKSTLRMIVPPSESAPGGEVAAAVAEEGVQDEAKKGDAPESVDAKPQPESYIVLFFEPIRQFLEDDSVSEVMINGPDQIYIERRGKVETTDATFINEQALQAAVKRRQKTREKPTIFLKN